MTTGLFSQSGEPQYSGPGTAPYIPHHCPHHTTPPPSTHLYIHSQTFHTSPHAHSQHGTNPTPPHPHTPHTSRKGHPAPPPSHLYCLFRLPGPGDHLGLSSDTEHRTSPLQTSSEADGSPALRSPALRSPAPPQSAPWPGGWVDAGGTLSPAQMSRVTEWSQVWLGGLSEAVTEPASQGPHRERTGPVVRSVEGQVRSGLGRAGQVRARWGEALGCQVKSSKIGTSDIV